MADELIAVTVCVLLEKAIAMTADGTGLMMGFLDDLKDMEDSVKTIQAVLTDAAAFKQYEIKLWVKKVGGAILEAEKVLDELLYKSLQRQVQETQAESAKVCSFFSLTQNDISFRRRMGSRVRAVNEKLKNIKLEVQNIGLVRVGDTNLSVKVGSRLSNSVPGKYVVGRVREESEIVDMLLLGSSDNNVRVPILPIIGMAGLGKTTLARAVYNNENIKGRFSKRGWISMGGRFEVTNMLKMALESLSGTKVHKSSRRDEIVNGIQKELSGERFMFVFDDVCNEDPELWDSFFTSLVGFNPASGSCCVLTTHLYTTGRLVSTLFSPFELYSLPDDNCWQILVTSAANGEEVFGELIIYREWILNRCRGTPLAVNVIGGLLSLQKKDDWLSIIENKVLKLREFGYDMLPILKLSYDYLPSPYIKKCFAYCSVYPKNATLDAQELIELWMAEGFLQEDLEGRTMEEIGAHYLAILLQCSLLEKENNDWYQMHDLVHDLAESISIRVQSRHVALGETDYYWNTRSPLVQIVNSEVSKKMLLKYRHARVLRLFSAEIVNLPKAIGKLKHLHYLDLSVGKIKSLPESLCKLYNLQTLRLYDCHNLQSLPQGLSNLINLRHLHFYSGDSYLEMPPMMGRLTRLQTLYFFNLMEKNDGRGIEQLGSMRNLKGNLVIRNLELVKGKEEARMANLFEKKNLTGLELEWRTYHDDIEDCDDEPVLEGLNPSPTLQKLSITSFMGIRFPQWLGKLSALVELELYDCKNCTELVGLDDGDAFPKLVSLSIHWCCKLSSAPSSFPSLETLTILGSIKASVVREIIGKSSSSLKILNLSHMTGLGSLSEVIGNQHNSSLEKLQICSCDDLVDIPSSTLECFPNLESFEIEGCPNLFSCPMNLQKNPSLSTILFSGCPKVFTTDAMPKGFNHLTNLKELSIGPFSDDSVSLFDWSGLVQGCSTSLQNLYLGGSLQNLPEQLSNFSSLVELKLHGFESVEYLPYWFGNFTSLRELELLNCQKLQHFPPTHVMECLKKLRRLEICNCPLLRESPGRAISGLSNIEVIRS